MVSDPVADALVRIKNGYLASRQEVDIPYSKLVFNLCELIQKEGYVESCQKTSRSIKVVLKYLRRSPVLTDVKRVSKPSLRVYRGVKLLPYVQDGLGVAIISTPKGLMTDKQARNERIGGEVMAYVW